jgi:thiol-disulfide isomerase/thioredoxin
VVLLNFWASWCVPCRVEFPSIARLHAAFADRGFTVVGIAVADTPDAITRFLGGDSAPFPILLDDDRKVAGEYRAVGVPVSYLLDRQGRIVGGRSGIHTWDSPTAGALIRYLLAREES